MQPKGVGIGQVGKLPVEEGTGRLHGLESGTNHTHALRSANPREDVHGWHIDVDVFLVSHFLFFYEVGRFMVWGR